MKFIKKIKNIFRKPDVIVIDQSEFLSKLQTGKIILSGGYPPAVFSKWDVVYKNNGRQIIITFTNDDKALYNQNKPII